MLKLKTLLNLETRQNLFKLRRRLLRLKERLVGGGELREKILIKLLQQHYGSQFRRQWELADEEPHFFSHRIGLFDFAFGEIVNGPFPYYRGFFSSEIVRDGDNLLDIGCGDGFFTKRFLGGRCMRIDAVDIEPSAIKAAQAYNSSPNITYRLLDAVNQPFPSDSYDVIVWDGALGHFSADTTHHMLNKIRGHLAPDGVFVGSESLGVEGSDHLQFFHSPDDLYLLFRPYFEYVELRSISYRIGNKGGFLRREGYWRCSNNPERLRECCWQAHSSEASNKQNHLNYPSLGQLSV